MNASIQSISYSFLYDIMYTNTFLDILSDENFIVYFDYCLPFVALSLVSVINITNVFEINP